MDSDAEEDKGHEPAPVEVVADEEELNKDEELSGSQEPAPPALAAAQQHADKKEAQEPQDSPSPPRPKAAARSRKQEREEEPEDEKEEEEDREEQQKAHSKGGSGKLGDGSSRRSRGGGGGDGSSRRGEERDRDRDRDRDRKDDKRTTSSRRSRSRDRKSERSRRSRSRSKDSSRRRRDARRSSRSKSRERHVKKSSSRRSRSRDRHRSRDRRHKRRSRSSSDDGGGRKPRPPRDPPPLANGPGTGADPFAAMRAQVMPINPQTQLRSWQLQQLEARAMILEQQAKSAATATSKTQREIYVGGLVQNMVGGEALRTLFNSALGVQFAEYLMPGMDPVININMHPEGRFAFVELRAPEMATAALALSGQVQLMGCSLTVARPSGYVDPSKAVNASQAARQAADAFKRADMQALAAAALAGANLKGLGLPPHIEDPATVPPPMLPPGVAVEGLTALPTPCLCFLGMVTAVRLKDDQEYQDPVGRARALKAAWWGDGVQVGASFLRPHAAPLRPASLCCFGSPVWYSASMVTWARCCHELSPDTGRHATMLSNAAGAERPKMTAKDRVPVVAVLLLLLLLL